MSEDRLPYCSIYVFFLLRISHSHFRLSSDIIQKLKFTIKTYVFFLLLSSKTIMRFSGISRSTDEIWQYGKRSSLTFLGFLVKKNSEIKIRKKKYVFFLLLSSRKKNVCEFREYLGLHVR